MLQHAIRLAVNPSDETVRLGPLAVRFLITGDDWRTVAAFELGVAAAQRLARRLNAARRARHPPQGLRRSLRRRSPINSG